MINKNKSWVEAKNAIRNRLLSGILLLMPFGITVLVIRWLFKWTASILQPIMKTALPIVSQYSLLRFVPENYINISTSIFSIVVLLCFIYLVGAIGQLVIGRKIITAGEALLLRIPLASTIYTSAKQVMQAVALPQKAAFRSVVLIEYPRPGFKAIGFLTGHIKDAHGKNFCKVFVPTTPNPTSGFLEIVPAEEVQELTMNTEEAFKMIISGGLVAPEIFSTTKTEKSGLA